MNLRRLRQWFASPDAVRSPWKRRLVWGSLFVLVLAGVVPWRGSRPTMAEDILTVGVEREEAATLAGVVERMIKERAADAALDGDLKEALYTIRTERVTAVIVHSNQHAEVRTTFAPDWNRSYHFNRDGKGWGKLLDIEELIAP